MASARIALVPGGTKEQYDYLGKLMGEGVANQPDRRLLAAGPTADGWMIIQVWESKDELDRFVQEVLGPTMQQAGDRGYPNPPQITDVDLTELHM